MVTTLTTAQARTAAMSARVASVTARREWPTTGCRVAIIPTVGTNLAVHPTNGFDFKPYDQRPKETLP